MSSNGILVALALIIMGAVVFIGYLYFTEQRSPETGEANFVLEREVIGGPTSGRPYSPAVLVNRVSIDAEGERTVIGRTLYVSGQVAIDPETQGEVRDDVAAETRQVLTNVRRWTEEAGFALSDAVKCTVFLADIGDYDAMNRVYVEFFPENPPARECVAVKEIVRGFRVEISLTAEK